MTEQKPFGGAIDRSALRSLGAIGGALAAGAAVIVGVVLAFVFAATVVVIGLMVGVVLALLALAVRASRIGRRRRDSEDEDGVIEARNVGGHHWVAYGWNERA